MKIIKILYEEPNNINNSKELSKRIEIDSSIIRNMFTILKEIDLIENKNDFKNYGVILKRDIKEITAYELYISIKPNLKGALENRFILNSLKSASIYDIIYKNY